MSLESFIGLDAGEGMSEAAFEAFKEKMKKAAAQIAAIKKEESKQKKKESELLKILLAFVKKSQKKDLVLLISRVLEQNIPANFVLAIILLSNKEEIEENELKMFKNLLPEGEKSSITEEKSLIFFGSEDETLPLKIKIELDNWIKELMVQSEENPQKILKTAYEIEMIKNEEESGFTETKYIEKKTIRTALIQLVTYIVREFLEQNKIDEPFSKLHKFSKFIIQGILNKTQEGLDNRRFLEA